MLLPNSCNGPHTAPSHEGCVGLGLLIAMVSSPMTYLPFRDLQIDKTWDQPKGYEHLEFVHNRQGKSEPFFLVYRNGNLLETVRVSWPIV